MRNAQPSHQLFDLPLAHLSLPCVRTIFRKQSGELVTLADLLQESWELIRDRASAAASGLPPGR